MFPNVPNIIKTFWNKDHDLNSIGWIAYNPRPFPSGRKTMRICAIDLKSNEANLCLLELDQGLMNVPDCRAKKLTLINPSDTQAMRDYQRQFAKLIEDYKIEKLVIRERPMNGKFAGSAASFKIEAALQLLSIDCEIISAKAIKDAIKNQPILVSIKELGLKQFQEQAFTTGYAYLNR